MFGPLAPQRLEGAGHARQFPRRGFRQGGQIGSIDNLLVETLRQRHVCPLLTFLHDHALLEYARRYVRVECNRRSVERR